MLKSWASRLATWPRISIVWAWRTSARSWRVSVTSSISVSTPGAAPPAAGSAVAVTVQCRSPVADGHVVELAPAAARRRRAPRPTARRARRGPPAGNVGRRGRPAGLGPGEQRGSPARSTTGPRRRRRPRPGRRARSRRARRRRASLDWRSRGRARVRAERGRRELGEQREDLGVRVAEGSASRAGRRRRRRRVARPRGAAARSATSPWPTAGALGAARGSPGSAPPAARPGRSRASAHGAQRRATSQVTTARARREDVARALGDRGQDARARRAARPMSIDAAMSWWSWLARCWHRAHRVARAASDGGAGATVGLLLAFFLPLSFFFAMLQGLAREEREVLEESVDLGDLVGPGEEEALAGWSTCSLARSSRCAASSTPEAITLTPRPRASCDELAQALGRALLESAHSTPAADSRLSLTTRTGKARARSSSDECSSVEVVDRRPARPRSTAAARRAARRRVARASCAGRTRGPAARVEPAGGQRARHVVGEVPARRTVAGDVHRHAEAVPLAVPQRALTARRRQRPAPHPRPPGRWRRARRGRRQARGSRASGGASAAAPRRRRRRPTAGRAGW